MSLSVCVCVNWRGRSLGPEASVTLSPPGNCCSWTETHTYRYLMYFVWIICSGVCVCVFVPVIVSICSPFIEALGQRADWGPYLGHTSTHTHTLRSKGLPFVRYIVCVCSYCLFPLLSMYKASSSSSSSLSGPPFLVSSVLICLSVSPPLRPHTYIYSVHQQHQLKKKSISRPGRTQKGFSVLL